MITASLICKSAASLIFKSAASFNNKVNYLQLIKNRENQSFSPRIFSYI